MKNEEPATDDILLNEISILEKRITILKSTIESYKKIDETNIKLIEAIKYGHELDIKNNYIKK